MTATAEPGIVERLRAWAKGSLPLEASVELLVRAFDGRFARADQPWIRIEANGATWLDDQFLASSLEGLSGGERRVLTVVVALADVGSVRRVDLTDVVTGIDRASLDLVLAALAHAGGSHEHAGLIAARDGIGARLEPLAALHPWPTLTLGHTPGPAAAATAAAPDTPIRR
jgi:hypothetical protein